ncbi:MAG: VOC family protein [Bryobacteraceae bacterium]|nr:VOC family protein [Bryobacteraceae bacterium]
MIAVQGLFEAHLTVSSLDRALPFYRDTLGLAVARVMRERGVAFFWLGAPGDSMLGLWETGTGPQRMSLHVAFAASLEQVLEAPSKLMEAGITPLDFDGRAATEPVVFGWMPAASVFFRDPDGNLLEYIAMLAGDPKPALGAVPWSEWRRAEL